MATTVGTESTLEDLLEDLVALHYDAADAYRTAIDRLDDARFRNRLAEFRRDHCATSLNWRYPLERGPAPSQRHQCLPPRLSLSAERFSRVSASGECASIQSTWPDSDAAVRVEPSGIAISTSRSCFGTRSCSQ